MNVEVIEALVKVLSDSKHLTELEVREGDATLRLRRPAPSTARPSREKPSPARAVATPASPVAADSPAPSGVVVNSELVGVFRARRPDAVDAGHTVKAKHVLGQIEAMRLMNDVTAPQPGRIQAVLVQDGQPVEYGQPLFEIAPEENP